MLKKVLFFASLTALAGLTDLNAAIETVNSQISDHGTPVAVSVATGAYTNVTSTTTRSLFNMTGILIDNPSTNTGIVHGHVGNCTSTSISTSSVKGPIEIAPSANGGSINLGPDECLWLVSRHTAAESITIQPISEKR